MQADTVHAVPAPKRAEVADLHQEPREVADKADAVIRLGGRFTAEELMTGLVSLACEYDDRDVALEVCENGPKVMETADKVVINAYRYAVEGKRQDYCEEDKP